MMAEAVTQIHHCQKNVISTWPTSGNNANLASTALSAEVSVFQLRQSVSLLVKMMQFCRSYGNHWMRKVQHCSSQSLTESPVVDQIQKTAAPYGVSYLLRYRCSGVCNLLLIRSLPSFTMNCAKICLALAASAVARSSAVEFR